VAAPYPGLSPGKGKGVAEIVAEKPLSRLHPKSFSVGKDFAESRVEKPLSWPHPKSFPHREGFCEEQSGEAFIKASIPALPERRL